MSNKKYLRYTWFVVFWVFFVILAGGIVRMTQSGMGCPDWPTCFGRWIPPTSKSQLPDNYKEKYMTKQDIDPEFNVYHTWTEWLNRMVGAVLGVLVFIHLIWSWRKYRKTDRSIVWISLLLLLATGFQGWLGKKVVDHNLAAVKVTTHMIVALLIAALPLLIIYKLKAATRIKNNFLKWFSMLVLVLVVVQVAFGTQVREQVDEYSKPLKYLNRDTWMDFIQMQRDFLAHRSFSWIVAAACLILCIKAWRYDPLRTHALFITLLVVLTILIGVTMAWYDIPALAQCAHLFIASILTLSVFSFILRVQGSKE
ncbi:MAG TPA: COX15/CtaA family protein [Chitinophagaceae bacterium]|nr:COX15/CtaA family protein [Chitinophagaceae bacterium]